MCQSIRYGGGGGGSGLEERDRERRRLSREANKTREMVQENEPCPEVDHVTESSRIHDLSSTVTAVTKWQTR